MLVTLAYSTADSVVTHTIACPRNSVEAETSNKARAVVASCGTEQRRQRLRHIATVRSSELKSKIARFQIFRRPSALAGLVVNLLSPVFCVCAGG